MAGNLRSPGALLLSDSVSCQLFLPRWLESETDSGKEQYGCLSHSLLLVIYPAVYKRVFCRPIYVNDEPMQGISFSTLRLSVSSSLNEGSNFL